MGTCQFFQDLKMEHSIVTSCDSSRLNMKVMYCSHNFCAQLQRNQHSGKPCTSGGSLNICLQECNQHTYLPLQYCYVQQCLFYQRTCNSQPSGFYKVLKEKSINGDLYIAHSQLSQYQMVEWNAMLTW